MTHDQRTHVELGLVDAVPVPAERKVYADTERREQTTWK